MDIEVVQQSVTPQLPVLALLEVVSAIGVLDCAAWRTVMMRTAPTVNSGPIPHRGVVHTDAC